MDKLKIAFLIFEIGGHHRHFAQLVIDVLCKSYDTVEIVSPPELHAGLAEIVKNYDNVVFRSIALPRDKSVLTLMNSAEYHAVYIDSVDSVWSHIILSLMWRKILCRHMPRLYGLLVGAGFAYADNRSIPLRRLKSLLLRYLATWAFDRLFFLDEYAMTALFPRGNSRCMCLPDPIEPIVTKSRLELRNRYEIPVGRKILLWIGLMNRWKRPDLLLKSFLSMPPAPDEYLYLLGEADDVTWTELKRICENSSGKDHIHMENRRLEEHELGDFLQLADAAAITYPNWFSNASFYFRSVICRTQPLLANCGWMKIVAKQEGIAILADPFDEASMHRGIRAALQASALPEHLADNMAKLHSEDKFKEILAKALAGDCGTGNSGE